MYKHLNGLLPEVIDKLHVHHKQLVIIISSLDSTTVFHTSKGYRNVHTVFLETNINVGCTTVKKYN